MKSTYYQAGYWMRYGPHAGWMLKVAPKLLLPATCQSRKKLQQNCPLSTSQKPKMTENDDLNWRW